MTRILRLPLFLLLAAAPAAPLRAELVLGAATVRPPLDNRVGEPIVFALTLLRDGVPVEGRASWYLEMDGAPGEGIRREVDIKPGEPGLVTAVLDRPGFVRLAAATLYPDGLRDGNTRCLAAGADVAELHGADEPEDFDAFWARVRAEADAADLSASFAAPAPDAVASRFPGFQVRGFRAPFADPDAAPATGWVLWRTGAPHRSLPLEVRFEDYGMDGDVPAPEAADPDALVVCVNAHGFELGRERAYYVDFMNRVSNGGNGGAYGFRNAENDNPETCYFRGMVARDLLALRFARSLPQWDGETLRVSGAGQGGFQAVAAAALDPAVTACRADEPWLCDLAAADFARYGGWRPAYRPALRYFDAANLAARVKCRATVFCPAASHRCPPSGVLILYNRLAGPKSLLFAQNVRRFGPGGEVPPGAQTQLLECPEPESSKDSP